MYDSVPDRGEGGQSNGKNASHRQQKVCLASVLPTSPSLPQGAIEFTLQTQHLLNRDAFGTQ
jgi:hypothetical protein